MSKIRVCFLGTSDFAVTSLKEMLNDEHFEVVGVVTQPDRPSGRKMRLSPSPVKSLALGQGLSVISPDTVNQPLILEEIDKWGAEIAVVVSFGQILSASFLKLFEWGAVNVHGSLLPSWRGAAPIQRAIQAGQTETGVSLQKMVKDLDAGDVIGFRKCAITPNMNAKELHDQLATMGADLLHVELMDYIRGNLAPIPQNPSLVTYAKKIDKVEGEIVWHKSAIELHNQVRAFIMSPGSWTTWRGMKMKIHKTQMPRNGFSYPQNSNSDQSQDFLIPGSVVKMNDDSFSVACGQSGKESLVILELQMESRNKVSAKDFLKSKQLQLGDVFGGQIVSK